MPQFLVADPADLAACRALLCSGSRSFHAASLLLPRRVRDPATALYAFCRVADDEIDLGEDPVAAVEALFLRLDAAYAGVPMDSPIDRAFAATVARYDIPRTLPAALIEGLGWDSTGRRYADFPALLDYAARVAGTVGVMMAVIMGVRDEHALARAADLGVAMQLTNIARDVGEDARAGRLFLPLDWLAAAGIDSRAFLFDPAFSPAMAGVIRRLLDEADMLYARAAPGIAALPLGCRTGIAAAGRIYAAIGRQIRLAGYDSITRRARVSGRRKLGLAGRALADGFFASDATAPALPANMFLVTAAAIAPVPPEPNGFEKLINMFERLERAQREGAAAVPDRSLA
jgi:phytoene synthase